LKKPFTSYHIYDGNLFDQVDKAVVFVLDAIRLPVIQQEHTAQVSRPYEIPIFAIQEAIVNALAHRDYDASSGLQVMLFLERNQQIIIDGEGFHFKPIHKAGY